MTDEELKRLVTETADRAAAKTRDHFEVVVEGLEQKIQLVAEGVSVSTQRIEDVRGDIGSVREQIGSLERGVHREFEEVRSMIQLSYTELQRRLRTLEETVASLQERMDRFEAGAAQ